MLSWVGFIFDRCGYKGGVGLVNRNWVIYLFRIGFRNCCRLISKFLSYVRLNIGLLELIVVFGGNKGVDVVIFLVVDLKGRFCFEFIE